MHSGAPAAGTGPPPPRGVRPASVTPEGRGGTAAGGHAGPSGGGAAALGCGGAGGAQARLAEALPLGRGLPAALAVASGAWEVPPDLLRAPVQGLQALRAPTQVARMARSPGDGSADRPRVVHQGDAVVAWLRLVAGRADTIAPCVAPVGGPSPWRTRRSSGGAAASGRPRALPARQSDPAAAPVAQTGSRVGSCRAGVPSGSGGPDRPCHGLPGSRPPSMRGKTRSEPRVHCGPRVGRARGGTSQAGHSCADHGPGSGVVAGLEPGRRRRARPQERTGEAPWRIKFRQTPPELSPICKTRNQFYHKMEGASG